MTPDMTLESANLLKLLRARVLRLFALLLGVLGVGAALLVYVVYVDSQANNTKLTLSTELEALQSRLRAQEEDFAKKTYVATQKHAGDMASARREIETLQASIMKSAEIPDTIRTSLAKIPAEPVPSSDAPRSERECNRGRGMLAACTARAYQFLGTSEPRADLRAWNKALKWLDWGCPATRPIGSKTRRDPEACMLLGRAFRRGTPGRQPDKVAAEKYYKMACLLGSTRGCMRAGQIDYESFKKSPSDDGKYEDALFLFAVACAGGDGEGCYLQAAAMSYDSGMTSNDVWGVVKRACAARYYPACAEMGRYPSPFRVRQEQMDGILERQD